MNCICILRGRLPGYFFSLVGILLLGSGCRSGVKSHTIDLPDGKRAVFLRKTAGRQAICRDQIEGYFDKVSYADLRIQLRSPLPDSTPRPLALQQYRRALKEEVLPFTEEDSQFLSPIIRELARILHQISPELLPQEIGLIKIRGTLYGPNVFYTRENNIIIPQPILARRDRELTRNILLHELFHIFSRYHPRIREDLYALIGFFPLENEKKRIHLPETLRKTLLLNPDGIDYAYGIRLQAADGSRHTYLPLTSSQWHHYSAGSDSFLPHPSVYFARAMARGDSLYQVQTPDIESPDYVGFREIYRDLYRQIGENTNYITHPDEILADNFTLLATGALQDSVLADRIKTPDLVLEMEKILKANR